MLIDLTSDADARFERRDNAMRVMVCAVAAVAALLD
jgi:hypothetical protein